jgi:hypothetical protein
MTGVLLLEDPSQDYKTDESGFNAVCNRYSYSVKSRIVNTQ